jgi:hypothetical protein
MGWEHEAETVWQAQELYCVDRLSFDAVAKATGVAASTLKRWSERDGWRNKREEIARAQAGIRADKVLARAKMIKSLIDKPRADTAFGVAALESLTLKEAEAARRGAMRAGAEEAPALSISTPGEALAALRKAVEQKLCLLLSRPENVDLRAVQEVQKCLALVGQLEAAQGVGAEKDKPKALSEENLQAIRAALGA